ncbi:MAG: hypothetical protein ACFE0P_10315 [Oceanicaulis sp.]
MRLPIVLTALVLSGCASADLGIAYGPASVAAFTARAEEQPFEVALGRVETSLRSATQMQCRMMLIDVFPSEIIASRLEHALRESGTYNHRASVEIRADLLSAELVSIGESYVALEVHVSSTVSDGYSVRAVRPYENAVLAVRACENAERAIYLAADDIVRAIAEHPRFSELHSG